MSVLYIILQCTWGILQTFIGAVLYLFVGKKKRFFHHGAIVSECKFSVSLGMFVFIRSNNSELLRHEYAHTLQSLMLGPLYLIVVGLPSIIWAGLFNKYRKRRKISYRAFYTEKWADRIAEDLLGENF